MPVRIKLPARAPNGGSFIPVSTIAKIVALSVIAAIVIAVAVVWTTYAKYSRLADQKLAEGLFPKSSLLYAAPEEVGVGDPGTPLQFAARLRESGYGEDARNNPTGWYHLRSSAIEVFPGPQSYGGSEPGVIRFQKDKISQIIALSDNSARTEYTLEPKLLSSLFDKNREKRRLVKFNDIPPVLVHAVISAEDKRFFQHSGLDPVRITKSVIDDLRRGTKFEGASTLTQQLARMLWLNNRKTFDRKFDEMMITIHLERKLTKEQIFEYYANEVPLGRRGSFAIRGFGEASQAFFGKDIRNLTLDEAATLAGLVQEPSFRNPVRWPQRAQHRRNVVLKMMLDNGYISERQYEQAKSVPLTTSKGTVETADAPYFIDIVNERLGSQFQDRDFQSSGSKIYTTLDPDLQRDAADAVALGMEEVRQIIAKRHRKNKSKAPLEDPQVALICLDPHTGEVKALVGGTNYTASQYDHALAKRPSGSVFKPFVYATAINTGLAAQPNPITPSSMFEDQPRTFMFNNKPYQPADYHHGNAADAPPVSVGEALAKSLNVPAVEVAEAVGYKNVADLAHEAGLDDVRPTPAMALGAYDVTPLDMAGAYTIFANNGVMVQPRLLTKVVDGSGTDVWTSKPETKQVLDPRVNFIMVHMMEQVLRSGTGAGVRARGFTLPAAGKTGTSHDAWFAGFTSKLLTIVWVGLDDYQDLKMEGAQAALPVWTDFMKRAHKHRAYRDVSDFQIPNGVTSALVDPDSGDLATTACPQTVAQYYLTGTQPVQFCPLHPGGIMEVAGYQTNPNGVQQQLPTAPAMNTPRPPNAPGMSPQQPQQQGNMPLAPGQNPAMAQTQEQQQAQQQPEKKKGFFGRLKGIFH